MYEDPELLERGSVLRASDYLSDPNTYIVVVISGRSRSTLHLHTFDPFQSFITTMLISLYENSELRSNRVFTVR
jgi:hypothetical protein